MDSSRITVKQAEKLMRPVGAALRFFHFLRRRCDKRGFPADDRLYRLIQKVYAALHELHVEVHYLTCRRGVAREQRPESGDDSSGPERAD